MRYKVGDKVRIVDRWVEGCGQNGEGRMDKWLGKVMTIREVIGDDGLYRMVEDQNDQGRAFGWYWSKECIAGLAENFEEKSSIDGDTSALRDMAAASFSRFKGLWEIVFGHETSSMGNAGKQANGIAPKFEAGDRVTYHKGPNLDTTAPFGLKDGESGTVSKVGAISGGFLYLVEFDHYDNPEGCVVREAELTKRPIYYTAKIVCVDNHHLSHWKVGKIYPVTDGQLEGDDVPFCQDKRYMSLKEINDSHFAQFIEVVD